MNSLSTKLMTAYRTKMYPNYWDILSLLLVFAVMALFAWNAKQMATPYQLGQTLAISLDPANLPSYAARTVVRMLIALVFSFLFTFTFGTWAAKSKRAEKIILPLIDVLQSVPILGFLSITITGFIALFPGSLLGPECATIFLIFTSQAWNMALSFYQTVKSVPAELKEASRMLNLSSWQCFWRIEVPYSMPGLLWNTMVSMSGGWFFVVAAEAITISNQTILLPGIGSYIATAIQAADLHAVGYAITTMIIVIIIYDQLLFRPLVAWSEKFKAETVDSEGVPESWIINLFRRARMMRLLGQQLARLANTFVNARLFLSKPCAKQLPVQTHTHERAYTYLRMMITMIITIVTCALIFNYIKHHLSLSDVTHVFLLGLITATRVFIMIIICSLFWIPIGVWIGLKPKVAQIAQPLAQTLAAFPANLLYPCFVFLIVTQHLNPSIWLTPLMILGAQWYILFNVIAGVSTIPKDLFQVADNLGVKGWLRWSRLILPGILPYYVTGAISAAGGAWNASIVAEIASWGGKTVEAVGLGSYITHHTETGDFAHTVLGVGVMCILVLIFNRLIWRPLYAYATERFSLE
jgi:NitT/TauT family transport system permease protein